MGQVDGTDNPEFGTDQFNELVWIKDGPEWAIGGTQLVLRRIKMNLDTWDRLSTDQKEGVIGRKLSNGAPLTGTKERDLPNFDAAGEKGQQFFRRPFNYEIPGQEAGSLWTAYCANLSEQYVPIQTALDQGDLLNLWTTPVGSSIWVIPSGFAKGETLAAKLFG
jgi:dye decolorizing peroxidase